MTYEADIERKREVEETKKEIAALRAQQEILQANSASQFEALMADGSGYETESRNHNIQS